MKERKRKGEKMDKGRRGVPRPHTGRKKTDNKSEDCSNRALSLLAARTTATEATIRVVRTLKEDL